MAEQFRGRGAAAGEEECEGDAVTGYAVAVQARREDYERRPYQEQAQQF